MPGSLDFVSIKEALQLLQSNCGEQPIERVSINHCRGRILAEDLISKETVPPFDSAAMDGYAVRFSDVTRTGSSLRMIGEVAAGQHNCFSISSNQTVRVFTGAPMPSGADHVLIQEHAEVSDQSVEVAQFQERARHIRKAGGDFRAGDTILKKGTRISASNYGLLAAANHETVIVFAQPKIALITTGSELKPLGSVLEHGQIIESNSYALMALLEDYGASVRRIGNAIDCKSSIAEKFEEASAADIIITIGGASVGKHDLVRNVFTDLSGKFEFERIAVRPGKPTWFGTLSDQLVLGLPGNPTAAFVIASLLLKPLLSMAREIEYTNAFLASDISSNGPRETFSRANLKINGGRAEVSCLRDQDTSRVKVLSSTNCFLHRPVDDPERYAGDRVNVVMVS